MFRTLLLTHQSPEHVYNSSMYYILYKQNYNCTKGALIRAGALNRANTVYVIHSAALTLKVLNLIKVVVYMFWALMC